MDRLGCLKSSLKDRFHELSVSAKDAPAVRFLKENKEISISYGQLWDDVVCLGSVFFRMKMHKGKRIVLIGANSYEWIRTAFAVLCTDSILMLLSDQIPQKILTDQLALLNADLVLYDEGQKEKLSGYRGSKMSLDELICGDTKPGDVRSFLNLAPDPDRTAFVIFTSGSTGIPKGVMLSERSCIGQINAMNKIPGYIYIELINLPLYHILGFVAMLLTSVCMGQSVFLSGGLKTLFEELRIVRPRRLMVMPLQLKMMSELLKDRTEKEVEEFLGGRLEDFSSAGAPLPPYLKKCFSGLDIYVSDGYGMSEAGGGIAAEFKSMPKAEGTVGRLHACFEYRITDPDMDGFGELYLKGPTVFDGYLDAPQETEKVLTEGWLRTGDIAYVDDQRRIFLRGRADNLIVLQTGENVSPEPMEKIISGFEGVKECLLYEDGGALAVEIYTDDPTVCDKIREKIREMNTGSRLHEQIAFVRFRKVPFEKTESGKIRRRKPGYGENT